MKVKTYVLMRECIERGIGFGLRRCDKHEIEPQSEGGIDQIATETMGALCEYFDWDDEVSA